MSFPYSFLPTDLGLTLDEADVDSFFNELKSFTNHGIGHYELANKKKYTPNMTHAVLDTDAEEGFEFDGYITSERFYRPQIFGAPQPRFLAPTGSVYWHSEPYGWTNSVAFQGDITGASDYSGIPNACARIKLRHDAVVNIMATFYCFEFGGLNRNVADSTTYGGLESRQAGKVALKVDDDVYGRSAWRYIHVAHTRNYYEQGASWAG